MSLHGPSKEHSKKSLSSALAALALTSLLLPVRTGHAETDTPIHECDLLAAYPGYEQSVGPGVWGEKLDATAAIRACKEALETDPKEIRFKFQLGRAFLKAREYERAIPLLRAAAENEFLPAFLTLSLMHSEGWGIPQNQRQAFELTQRAADARFPAGQFALAQMYYSGAGVDQDFVKAFELSSSAASHGYVLAEHGLGLLYGRGHGVAQDYRIGRHNDRGAG